MAGDGEFYEVAIDELVLQFDGRVLEVFNDPDGSIRMHVSRMKIKMKPGFKKRLYVELRAQRRNTPRAIFEVKPEERPAFDELMAAEEIEDPALQSGYLLMGLSYDGLGDARKAETYWRQARDVDPRSDAEEIADQLLSEL